MARLYIGKSSYKIPDAAVAEFREQYRKMMEEESLDGRHTGRCEGKKFTSFCHDREEGQQSCLCPEAMAVYIFNNVLPVYVAKMRRAVRKQTGCDCGCPSRPRGDWGLCGDCSMDSAEADGFLQQLLKLL